MASRKSGANPTLSHGAYTHCRTKIVDLRNLKLPMDTGADDDIGASFYTKYSPQVPFPVLADFLLAIHTLRTGLAPPVAFPTETVYGLGADATRSQAVQGIFDAKNRPSDNPLIVHVSTLSQLRSLLNRPIPEIYQPLVEKFWPGPLTILLPLPDPNPFAPEVSCGRDTVGIRMPSTPLARLLISLVGKPLAAPSANASSRPSPTTAQHVKEDLDGRINFILDGGPCQVGVESTVVDGLCDPPEILRPGGIGIEQIRALGGKWANTVMIQSHHHPPHKPSSSSSTTTNDRREPNLHTSVNGDIQSSLASTPRAPGMKYKHYSPKARVILFQPNTDPETGGQYIEKLALESSSSHPHIGLVTTANWTLFAGLLVSPISISTAADENDDDDHHHHHVALIPSFLTAGRLQVFFSSSADGKEAKTCTIYNVHLPTPAQLARHLFAAFRTLDHLSCDVVLVEGIPDDADHLAGAVMNRLLKAAELVI